MATISSPDKAALKLLAVGKAKIGRVVCRQHRDQVTIHWWPSQKWGKWGGKATYSGRIKMTLSVRLAGESGYRVFSGRKWGWYNTNWTIRLATKRLLLEASVKIKYHWKCIFRETGFGSIVDHIWVIDHYAELSGLLVNTTIMHFIYREKWASRQSALPRIKCKKLGLVRECIWQECVHRNAIADHKLLVASEKEV